MDIQRLRNLTTGRLHTDMAHVYEDLGWLTGESGLMTHMLPNVLEACRPWLRANATDPRLWDGRYDRTHTGNYQLPTPSQADRNAMLRRYMNLPSPLG